MRNDGRVVEKERRVLVGADEFQDLLVDAVRRVILPLESIVAPRITRVGVLGQVRVARHGRIVLQWHATVVAPQIRRVVASLRTELG